MTKAGTVQVSADPELVVALEPIGVRDVELMLLGVLPRHHVIGRAISQRPDAEELTGVGIDASIQVRGRVVLTDEERTPLAVLTAARRSDADTVVGTLVAERARESGVARDRALHADDLSAPWSAVVVLARAPVDGELEGLVLAGTGSVLVLVPDHPSGTDGIPTTVMIAMADRLAGRIGCAVVRTAPIIWRDPASDRALLRMLEAAVDAPVEVLSALSGEGASTWASVRHALLDGRTSDTVFAQVLPADLTALQAWRRPRVDRGLVVLFSGLSGSGKSTVARAVQARIEAEATRTTSLLDGDVVRRLLSAGLGFDRESRLLNLRRIGWVAAEISRHGGISLCAPIAPYASIREEMRAMAQEHGDFVLVHVSTPLAECERRDLKGLYAAARAGTIAEFTGVSEPYEAPEDADVVIDTSRCTVEEATSVVFEHLVAGGWIVGAAHEH